LKCFSPPTAGIAPDFTSTCILSIAVQKQQGKAAKAGLPDIEET
jgi:hypothetical protein